MSAALPRARQGQPVPVRRRAARRRPAPARLGRAAASARRRADARARADGDADEVRLPRRRGRRTSPAARSPPSARRPAGTAPPQRLTIAKRVPSPPAWAAARPTPPPRCGSPRTPRASTTAALLHELAARLGADVPAQLAPRPRADDRRRRARRAAARPRARSALVIVPLGARALHARRSTASSTARPAARRRRARPRSRPSCAAGDAAAERLLNDLAGRRARALPADRRRARRRRARPAPRTRWSPAPARPCSASSPRRRAPRRRPRARALPARVAAGARRPPRRRGRCAAGVKSGLAARRPSRSPSSCSCAAASSAARRSSPGVLAVAGALLIGAGVIELPNVEKLIEDAGHALGKWTYLLVGMLAFLETGAFIGLVAPGETAVIVGGLVAGQGEISLLVLIAIVWACAVARRPHLVHARPPARPRVPAAPRRRGEDHRGAAAAGRGLLRAPRRHDDPDRPLHRLRPRARAVHRRHRRGCRCASSCPTTSSAPARGRRRSACSATSSGSRSTSSRSTSRAGCSRSALVVVIGVGVWSSCGCGATPSARESVAAWLRRARGPAVLRPLARLAGPLWRRCGRPAAAGADATARFGLRPPHARRPRARADHAARARRPSARSRFFLLGDAWSSDDRAAAARPLGADIADRLRHDMARRRREGRHRARLACPSLAAVVAAHGARSALHRRR